MRDMEKNTAWRKAWFKTPKGRAYCHRRAAVKLQKSPLQYAAHYITNNAIKLGRLTREPCEVCANPKTEAHHDDYGRPLVVRWLCKEHHDLWHKTEAK